MGLDAAAHCVDDMDEWLSIFNIKLRHMREDLESVGTFTFHVWSLIFLALINGVIEMPTTIMENNTSYCAYSKTRVDVYYFS